MHTSRSSNFGILSDTCHAGSITVKKSNGDKNIIDIMYEVNRKFEFVSTVGGFVLN